MTATINIYRLPQVVNVTTAPTIGETLMNYSGTRSDFKIMKGVSTEVHFFIKNTDREPVLVGEGHTVEIVITDTNKTKNILTKTATVVDGPKAIYKVTFTPDETAEWPIGLLTYTIIHNRVTDRVMLYTDRGFSGSSHAEVVQGPYAAQTPPEVTPQSEFRQVDGKFVSSAVKGNANAAFPSPVHSVVFYMTDFKGRLTLQASIEDQPTADDIAWFNVEQRDFLDQIQTIPVNFNAIGNYLWVRYVIEIISGDFTKVVIQR